MSDVLKRVRPSNEERERLKSVTQYILSEVEDLAGAGGRNVRPVLVGSAARGTWLSGDCDLDIFLAAPEDEDLKGALDLARDLAGKMAQKHEERYAEHAYVHAVINGFDVDLVPCYDLKSFEKIRSAVDRTPFHNRYVSARIGGLEDDVLLLKQFMKGTGVYGSELKNGGFSGYLTELLVISYGSFLEVLRNASSWRPGIVIDLEERLRSVPASASVIGSGPGSESGSGAVSWPGQVHEPLIVIDPVDPKRNVAAALTLDKAFQFSSSARCFLRHPSIDFFFPPDRAPISDEDLVSIVRSRGSTFILIRFSVPDLVEDIIFPQLRKGEESIKALFQRNGFCLLRSDVECFKAHALMLFELEVGTLPTVIRRTGPPVWEIEHVSKFLAAHPGPLSGPYIEGGRAMIEEARRYTRARDILASEIGTLSLGKHLNSEIRKGFEIYEGAELASIKDGEFRVFMAEYLAARKKVC